MADRLDPERFAAAVALLAACSGNVATTGAGTSGVVARKIAATLTSTGTPALFVHPSDALHGGLGAIGGQAIVIAVSKGGETEEVLALLPYLAHREVPVIAIVGEMRSTLARRAAIALEASVAREAGRYDLVPTASVAVALAVADALALTVMEAKGVTPEGFAANHPSGQLGRRLTLRVRDVMHSGDQRPTVGRDRHAARGRQRDQPRRRGRRARRRRRRPAAGPRHRRRRAPRPRGGAGSGHGALRRGRHDP